MKIGVVFTSSLVFATTAVVHAGIPRSQTATSAFDWRPVVRVERGDGGYGTGTVIGRTLYENGLKGKLCVLTADHVISATGTVTGGVAPGLRIATRNPDGSLGASVSREATVIGRRGREGAAGNAGRLWDLAVLEIDWGWRDTEFDLLAGQRYTVDSWTNTDLNFTSAGYGDTGGLTTNGGPIQVGYRHLNANAEHNDKKQRFWNNRVTQAPNNTAAPGGYVHDGLEWVLDNVDPALGTGEGTGLPGDSGSPLLFREGSDMYSPTVTSVYTRSLRGVFNAFESISHANGYDVHWGFKGFSVRITDANKAWIDQRCGAIVPEPASMLALALGASALIRRRRTTVK